MADVDKLSLNNNEESDEMPLKNKTFNCDQYSITFKGKFHLDLHQTSAHGNGAGSFVQNVENPFQTRTISEGSI